MLVPIPLGAASALLVGESGCVRAVSVRENTDAARATFSLFDGASANGILLAPYSLAAGDSSRDTWYPHTFRFQGGLYFELEAGAVSGSVIVDVGHDCHEHIVVEYSPKVVMVAPDVATIPVP